MKRARVLKLMMTTGDRCQDVLLCKQLKLTIEKQNQCQVSKICIIFICSHVKEHFTMECFFQVALPGVDYRTFLAVLEYLYTDNCTSLGNIPVEDVLVLADCLCLTRLVQICEVQMHKGLLNMTKKDLLDVLAFSKMFNAKQVTEWCLYVIGLNFLKYESVEKEFELIVSEHSQFFEKHCWPPQDHRKVLKKYRQSAKRNRWDKRQLTQRGSSCLPLNCHVM